VEKIAVRKVKVTIMLPQELWEEFKEVVPPGKRSKTVAEALLERLKLEKKRKAFEEAVKFSQKLRQKYGVLPSSVEDIRKMREELSDGID